MSIEKINNALLFAFQYTDGPFHIAIHYRDNSICYTAMNKVQIKDIANLDHVALIELKDPKPERRWRKRNSKERRASKRYYEP